MTHRPPSKANQASARHAPQILARARTTGVPADPITGNAQFLAVEQGVVVYQIWVFNPSNQVRWFTFYNSDAALDQGEAIIFPWAVRSGESREIEFPQGAFLDTGLWCVLSRNPDVLDVQAGDEMRLLLTVRSDGLDELILTTDYPDNP